MAKGKNSFAVIYKQFHVVHFLGLPAAGCCGDSQSEAHKVRIFIFSHPPRAPFAVLETLNGTSGVLSVTMAYVSNSRPFELARSGGPFLE